MTTTAVSESDCFHAAFQRRMERSDDPIRSLRTAAFDRFLDAGFPTRRDEAWRYTDVRPIARASFKPAEPPASPVQGSDLEPFLICPEGVHRLVFVNGQLAPDLSTAGKPGGAVRIGSLAQAIAEDFASLEPHLARLADGVDSAFTALNTALQDDGVLVMLPDGAALDVPVHVLHVTRPEAAPLATHPRNLIIAGSGCQATIIETYASLGSGMHFTNAVTEIVAGENTTLDHYKLQRQNTESFHVAATRYHQMRDSAISSLNVCLGGSIVRNELHTTLDGTGCDCDLVGLYLGHDRQHIDNHLRVDHLQPHCDSREYFKGVLDDASSAVFTGRIYVAQDAQKTDAKQTNMNLLLSRDAHVDTKPQLEIFADDVKCTHGATIGQLDEPAMFYLRSRGLNPASARALLVYGFVSECTERIRFEPVRHHLHALVLDHVPHTAVLDSAFETLGT